MAERMTLEEFKERFTEIKAQGWVPSRRRGPTGIGHTLEQMLGLSENNVALPNHTTAKLKAGIGGSSSLISLFGLDQIVWRMTPSEAIKRYGTPNSNGRLGLCFTMSRAPNSMGLFLYPEAKTITIRHFSGSIIAEWHLETLQMMFEQKLAALIFVKARSEMRGAVEWFEFYNARLMTGTTVILSTAGYGWIMSELRLNLQKRPQIRIRFFLLIAIT